jgi:hypothetical protein
VEQSVFQEEIRAREPTHIAKCLSFPFNPSGLLEDSPYGSLSLGGRIANPGRRTAFSLVARRKPLAEKTPKRSGGFSSIGGVARAGGILQDDKDCPVA